MGTAGSTIVERHPLAVVEPIKLRFPLARLTDEMRADFIPNDWLLRVMEEMFQDTPARELFVASCAGDELCRECLK